MKRTIIAIICFVSVSCLNVIAGRPLVIDDADPVDAGQYELELGASSVRLPDCKHWDFPIGLTYGLMPAVEIGIGFGGQYETRTEFLHDSGLQSTCKESGLGDLVIGAKWQCYKETKMIPRMAIVPSVKLPTADTDKGLGSGKTDFDLTWVASKTLSERMAVHVNVGYCFIGQPEEEEAGDIMHYGVASDYQIADSWQLVAEIFAENELLHGSNTAIQYNAGCRWSLVDNLTFDLAGGSVIKGDAPDLTVSAGLTLAFGN